MKCCHLQPAGSLLASWSVPSQINRQAELSGSRGENYPAALQALIPPLLQQNSFSHPEEEGPVLITLQQRTSLPSLLPESWGRIQPWTRPFVPPHLYLCSPAAREPVAPPNTEPASAAAATRRRRLTGRWTEDKAWLGPGRLAASSPPLGVRGSGETTEADKELGVALLL